MKVGIGLPAPIPGIDGKLLTAWARQADQGPFSSLGVIDRVVYPNVDALLALTAAAAVTERIGLMTTVLLGPLRNAVLLAKEAASLDVLSGGRFTLGLGVGARPDDFQAVDQPFKRRGRKLEEQLDTMKKVWAGEPIGDDVGAVGPRPAQSGGPGLLIGGRTPEAIGRVGRWADGYISGGSADPNQLQQLYGMARDSWQSNGRSGSPRLVSGAYFALGDQARERGGGYIKDYYGFAPAVAEGMAASIPVTPDAVKDLLRRFEDVGADEVILWPTIAELDQVQRVADLLG